jgi:hypothetical protein
MSGYSQLFDVLRAYLACFFAFFGFKKLVLGLSAKIKNPLTLPKGA